jgi:Na+-translocating ferredoxin:NAD+ oxidoreductase subunit G
MEENIHTESQSLLPGMTPEKEPSSFRLIFTLGLAGFIAGLVMVGSYLLTKPMIEANKAAAVERAILKVLPNCTSFKTLELRSGTLEDYVKAEKQQPGKKEAPKLVYMGLNTSNEVVGFAILGSEIGFADVISIMIGYDATKKIIIGYEVLDSKETPGLGDKIYKDEAFRRNFTELLTEPEIIFAKKGEKKNPNEVEAITGATISSKAVIRLLNKSMNEWKAPIAIYITTNPAAGGEQQQ